MKRPPITTSAIFLLFTLLLFGCYREDPGPQQSDTRSFAVVDFDRIEASEAVDLTVQQGVAFSINTKGDRRNLDDLQISKLGGTLSVRYNNGRNRKYTTYITITMPVLKGLNLSGAVTGRTTGFTQATSRFDLNLSGASTGQVEVTAEEVYASLSGASTVELIGSGKKIDADVSGASKLTAFDYPVEQAKVVASGASRAKINATQHLTVNASGASEVRYRGDPQVEANVAGASSVGKD